MIAWSESQTKKWEQIREKGQLRFILRSAIIYSLLFNFSFLILEILSDLVFRSGLDAWYRSLSLYQSLFQFAFWLLVGAGIGAHNWGCLEQEYKNSNPSHT